MSKGSPMHVLVLDTNGQLGAASWALVLSEVLGRPVLALPMPTAVIAMTSALLVPLVRGPEGERQP